MTLKELVTNDGIRYYKSIGLPTRIEPYRQFTIIKKHQSLATTEKNSCLNCKYQLKVINSLNVTKLFIIIIVIKIYQ